jgi:hypothetical protein
MKRIYKITNNVTGASRFVKADNRAQALRHVAESTYRIGVASANEIADAAMAGCLTVETAGTTPEGDAE